MTSKLLDFIKNHPKLVVAQDFELACQKIFIQKHQYLNGSCGFKSFDESWWVQLRVLHRNRPGIATAAALTEESLDRLVSQSLLSAEQSTPDPWFRFPVWSPRRDNQQTDQVLEPPKNFWDSSWGLIEETGVSFQERYEWWEIEAFIFRRSEKRLRDYRCSTGFQQWNLGRCQETFWGPENRKHRIQALKKAAKDLGKANPCNKTKPEVISINGRAMSAILQQISGWFCANQLRDKKSPFSELEENAQVMSRLITLFDDGERIKTPDSVPFDLDGIPSQKTLLIKEGVFKGALYDSYMGAMDNCRSTGNRLRRVHELEPQLRAKAICLEPGTVAPVEIWREQQQGIALEGWTRLGFTTEQALQGDAYGWRMEGGIPVEPLLIRNINWDLCDLMKRAFAVGNDTEKHGFSASPTLFFKGAL